MNHRHAFGVTGRRFSDVADFTDVRV